MMLDGTVGWAQSAFHIYQAKTNDLKVTAPERDLSPKAKCNILLTTVCFIRGAAMVEVTKVLCIPSIFRLLPYYELAMLV